MSGLLPLKTGIIYGPVRSRRLGRSLGINLLPPGRKPCTFDCVYCQYGWTPKDADSTGPEFRAGLPDPAAVASAVEEALRGMAEPPAYLTFSGNGEPTLHPEFPRMAEAVRDVRNRLAPSAGVAVLSNSSRLGRPQIIQALLRIDLPIMKLDAGNEAVFGRFNRPAPGVDYEAIVTGLEALAARREISLQSLFAGGPRGNLSDDHVRDWVKRIAEIRPRFVQVYSISRPVPSGAISPAPSEALLAVRDRLRRERIDAAVF